MPSFSRLTQPFRLVFLAACAVLAGCPGDLEDPQRFGGGADPCAAVDVDALFEMRCGTSVCHEGPDQTAPFDLLSPGVADRVLDVPAEGDDECTPDDRLLVDTTDIAQSYLLEKLDGSRPECGDPMPLLQAPLTSLELLCVEGWIEALVADEAGPMDGGV